MQTLHEAMTHPRMVRSRLGARSATGTTRLQTIIVQKSGAKPPRWVCIRTAISAESLPYHVVKRSANTK